MRTLLLGIELTITIVKNNGVIQVVRPFKYIMAEADGRIRLCEILEKPQNDDEKFRVFTRGRFMTHTQVNHLCKGYIKKKQDRVDDIKELDSAFLEDNTYIYGTACGQVGMLQTLPSDVFYYLNYLEWVMNRDIRSIGEFDEINFRMNDPRDDPYEKLELLECHKLSKRFIDGDFLALFNSLSQTQQQDIIDKVNTYQLIEIEENLTITKNLNDTLDENSIASGRHKHITVNWVQNVIKALTIN